MIELILLIFAIGVLAYEIAYSPLSTTIKNTIGLNNIPTWIIVISELRSYKKLFGDRYWLLFPIILIILMLSNLWIFLSKLFACNYCLAVWIGLAAGIILSCPLLNIFILMFVSPFSSSLYSYFRNNS